jgi:hypothetical protein
MSSDMTSPIEKQADNKAEKHAYKGLPFTVRIEHRLKEPPLGIHPWFHLELLSWHYLSVALLSPRQGEIR